MNKPIPAADLFTCLHDVLWPTIYCEEDVYTIQPVTYSNGMWFDKTQCEAAVNHIHLNDYIFCNNSESYRKAVFMIADMWAAKLKSQFPKKHFILYLTTENAKWNRKSNCVLRFCLKRDDEPEWTQNEANNKTLWIWRT